MDTIDRLAQLFLNFPGIGPRQAKRFVYYLLSRGNGTIDDLIRHLQELKSTIRRCTSCFRYFPTQKADSALCSICRDGNRDRSLLLVIEKDSDMAPIEKSGTYNGLYFILGGTVPILEKNPGEKIRFKELEKVIQERGELKEVILALSATPEGENTQHYLETLLRPLLKEKRLSSLGRGLSTGTELEYSDQATIRSALENRK